MSPNDAEGFVKDFLTALLADCSTRDALGHLGLSSNSFGSLRCLCQNYEVEIPKRTNQHSQMPLCSPVVAPKTRKHDMATPATRREIGVERAVVMGDFHVPFHDERAVSVALALVEDIQPEVIYLNGDVIDMYACSRFNKDPRRALELQDEIDQTFDILSRVRDAAPEARIVYIRGNHEARLTAFLQTQARELSGLRALDIRSLLSLDSLGIEWVEGKGKEAYSLYGVIKIGHFDRVSQNAGYTAKLLIDRHACSLVQGHTHRLAAVYRTYPDGTTVVGCEGGTLALTDPEYVSGPDWAAGLVVITKEREGSRFHVQPVAITGYRALYNDVLYEA